MGHSILKLRDAYAIFDDSELSLLIGLMAEAVRAPSSHYPLMGPFVQAADDNRPRAGPGTLNLELQLLSSSADARVEFREIVDFVRKRVESFGSAIPVAMVTQLERQHGVTYSRDYPTHYLTAALDKLEVLVDPSVTE